MLKDEISRKNIIQSMNHYNICSINEQHELSDKLQKILNKYKYSSYLLSLNLLTELNILFNMQCSVDIIEFSCGAFP